MAKINQGILGGFSGKIGNIVGGNWKGINYMRILTKPTNPNTEKQVNQRTKFTTALSFLQPITPFLRVGYKLFTAKQTAFNAAMSNVLTNGITGEAPNLELVYSAISVSKGTLTPAVNAAFSYDSGEITITWDDNSGIGTAKATDKAMYVVYNPAKVDAVFEIAGADRSLKSQVADLPIEWIGDTVHVYLAFITIDGKDIANSTYLGSVEVVAA
ncbi:MAG: DUF6266 family protein [Paludibacteraceae bacterium]